MCLFVSVFKCRVCLLGEAIIRVKPGPSLIPPLILEQRLHLYDTLLFPREGSDLDKHTLHFHKARQFLKSFSQLMTTPGQRRLNEIVHVNHSSQFTVRLRITGS